MKEFRSIRIQDATIEIIDGSVGTYNIKDIKRCSVLNEASSFRGKTDPFVHQVLGGASTFIAVEPKLFVGIKILTKEDKVLVVYISKEPVLFNSMQYLEDKKEADHIKKIIEKRMKGMKVGII